MRVVVATTAGAGHLGPLLPFARALRQGGHDVVITAPASFAASVERAGFEHRPFADGSPEEQGRVFASLAGCTNDEANAIVVRDVFGRIGARAALPGVRELIERRRPDLVVREPAELASYVAAEEAGIPHVQVAVGLTAFDELCVSVLEEPLAELGSRSGIDGLRSSPRLSLCPQSFDGPGAGETTRRYRDVAPAATGPLPEWWAGPDLPLVYVTFGSVAAGFGLFPALYQQVAAVVAELPVRVLMTTGGGVDLSLLGPLPANVHAEQWWPQEDVMPHTTAVVGHGGFGTTLAALVAGVPIVAIPLFADQPANAARVAAIGAGIALDGGATAVGNLADALQRVLDGETYARSARAVAEEIRELPAVGECVPFLEGVA